MAIRFDEVDDYFSAANSAALDFPNSAWCVGIWTKVTDNTGSAWQYLVSTNTYHGTPALNLYLEEASAAVPGVWRFDFTDDNGKYFSSNIITSSSAPGADGVWRLIVMQRSTANNRFELWFCTHGGTPSLEAYESDASFVGGTGQGINIGRRTDGNSTRYYGSDAAEFFKGNFALTSGEIAALGAGRSIIGIGKTPSVYLPMTSAEATLTDLAGDRDAAMQSAPTTVEHPAVFVLSAGALYAEKTAPAGGTTVTPTAISAITSTVAPTVVYGALTLTPGSVSAIASTVSPTVVYGALTVSPYPGSAIASTVAPTVITGLGGARVVYKIYTDVDDDLSFESSEDITAYVIRAEWSLGMTAWDHIANNGEMVLTLNNADKRFSPENTASPYYDSSAGKTKLMPLRAVRLTMNTGSGETVMWTGVIDYLDVMPGVYGERQATLHCVDNMVLVRNRNLVGIRVQENKRSDEVIEAILDLQTRGAWLIGVPGASEIGISTYVGGPRFGHSKIRTGQRTFVYAGDDWFGESTAFGKALEDTTRSEGWPARFFFDREGDPVFWDTSYLQALNDTPTAITDTNVEKMSYQHGREVFNEIVVRMNPRVEGSSGTVLFSNKASAVKLTANGGTRTIRANFVDANGTRIGASAVITPVEGTDFTLNTAADGSGTGYTTGYTVTASPKGDYADISFMNTNAVDIYVIDLQLRGTPLEHFDPLAIKARNNESVSRYGLRQLQYNAPLLNDVEIGAGIANYMVQMRGIPHSEIAQVALNNGTDTRLGYIEDVSIGATIAVTEAQTGIDAARYIVVGERHVVSDSGKKHVATWYVEPTSNYRSWLIGVTGRSEIGLTTYVGI